MEPAKCGKCGCELPTDAPNELCPRCLMEIGLTDSQDRFRSGSARNGPEPGTRLKYFGDYELLERIAQGGMGVVYKARQTSLNRVVALKMILGGQLAGDTEVQRFLTEAEAAANLQHPNIVAIHEVGEHEGQHYFSMDYVEGENLAEYSRGYPVSPAQAAQIVKILAETIHYAHQRGTLHRDLKPSNILMDRESQPRITDFGLAKRMEHESGVTETGAVLGSPGYMAPEQAAGQNHLAGPSGDVYSLGAILYHLLTGRAPFSGESSVATLRQVIEEEPASPSKLNPNTPADLETICLKCLEKRVERRYYSAADLASELGRFLQGEPILARPAGAAFKAWSWCVRRPWAIAGIAAIFGTLVLGLAYGLWEQVKFLEWKGAHPNAGRSGDLGSFLSDVMYANNIGLALLVPIALFYQLLKYRRRWNIPVGKMQAGLLALGGILLIGIGLGTGMFVIRTFVWTRLAPFSMFAGIGLGVPLLLCWLGGVFGLQALRWRQAQWSGLTSREDLFEPRSLESNAPAFAVALVVNTALFMALSHVAIPDGLYPEYELYDGWTWEELGPPENVPYGLTDGPKIVPAYGMIRIGFFLVAFGVSLAPRLFAARRVIPVPLAVFYWLFFIGGTSLVHFHFLPGVAFIMAILAGLAGGWVLQKAARLRVAPARTESRPVRARDLFQWDAKGFGTTLAGSLAGLCVLAGFLFHWEIEHALTFVVISSLNALWPLLILACRETRGPWRTFFLGFIPVVVFATAYPVGGAMAGFAIAKMQLLAIPAGLATGWLLIRLGSIRPGSLGSMKPC